MAINYALLEWDTTKYVNPTNMNHMDYGIKAACDGVDNLDATTSDIVNILSAKNLLPYPYYSGATTINNVVVTDNGDGTLTFNGTASAPGTYRLTHYNVAHSTETLSKIPNGNYIATGGSTSAQLKVGYNNSGTISVYATDTGNGANFSIDHDSTDYTGVYFELWFASGTVFNNFVVKPMIRPASISDSTYEPYAMTNKQITDAIGTTDISDIGDGSVTGAISELEEDVTLLSTTTATSESFALTGTSEGNALAHTLYGMSVQDGTPTPSSPVDIDSSVANYECVGKNLIPYPYFEGTETDRGITYTNNDDGTVTISAGTPQSGTNHVLVSNLSYYQPLKKDTQYILSSGYAGNKAYVRLQFYRNGSAVAAFSTFSSGVVTVDTTGYTFDALQIQIFVIDTLSSAITFYPMLRLASVTDDTYEPYQSHTADTDLTLRAIEVTSSDDYNLVRDGKYYIADTVDWSEDDGYVLTRRIGTKTLSSDFSGLVVADLGGTAQRYAYVKYLLANTRIVISNCFQKGVNLYDAWGYIRTGGSGNCDLVFGDGGDTHQFDSLDAFKTWIDNNTVILNYDLATPIITPLTAEQAEALLSLKTYDTATSITCTSDVAPTMELEYASGRVTALALTGHNEAELKVDWASENVLGAKNLLGYPYYDTTKTLYGITFTLNSDHSVTVNGTATGNAYFIFHSRSHGERNDFTLANGKYIANGCPSGGSTSTYYVQYSATINGVSYEYGKETGEGLNLTLAGDDFSTDEVNLQTTMFIINGTTVNNLTFYPMIRPASVKDSTYTPYAMTNKELTDVVKCTQTTAGTYTLQATVASNGTVTYSWV